MSGNMFGCPSLRFGNGNDRVEIEDAATHPSIHRTPPNNRVICSIMSLMVLRLRDLGLEYRGCLLVPIKLLPDGSFDEEQRA